MEAITRLVADSLARHGFDRPVDPRRLQWSRWFRCDSPHSLLTVPSKPGIFALSEEIMDLGTNHGGTAALGCPAEQRSAVASTATNAQAPTLHAAAQERRMLAVIQFSEDDDMAFTLDRMFTRINPMRERLASGKCFLRFVVIEDQAQRRSICAALNQWMAASAEKSTGLPAGFSTSLEFTTDHGATDALVRPVDTTDRVGRTLLSDSDSADATTTHVAADAACPERSRRVRPPDTTAKSAPAPLKTNISAALQSGAASNLHCPHPLPSGF
jgi:hypothetical protein